MSESASIRLGPANQIIAALEPGEYDRFAVAFEYVALPIETPILEPDRSVAYVTFPLSGVHSVTALMHNGASVEVGIIDKYGAIGGQEVLADATPSSRCFTQLAGDAVRVPAAAFLDEFARDGGLRRAFLRWTQAYVVQISQTAACNRLHSVDVRLARWLLICHDRAETDDVSLTQEFLSIMLATPRPGITKAMGRLTADGCIRHTRGSIVVIDRERLEDAACECYEIVHRAFERLSVEPVVRVG